MDQAQEILISYLANREDYNIFKQTAFMKIFNKFIERFGIYNLIDFLETKNDRAL